MTGAYNCRRDSRAAPARRRDSRVRVPRADGDESANYSSESVAPAAATTVPVTAAATGWRRRPRPRRGGRLRLGRGCGEGGSDGGRCDGREGGNGVAGVRRTAYSFG
jgi:hypothetical protein